MLAKRKTEKFDFLELLFQINRYDKEVSLNVVVRLWIAFDTFAKKRKKEMVVHQKNIRKNSSINCIGKCLRNYYILLYYIIINIRHAIVIFKNENI